MCGSIAWCDFTWQAFATLTTGALAVGGATWIGLRQVGIQNLKLRADLFDRRFRNYEAVRDFLNSVLSKPDEIDSLALSQFFVAQREARFLFGAKVCDGLSNIWTECGELNAISLEINSQYAQNGHAGVDLPQKKQAIYTKIDTKYRNLYKLYNEINLSK